MQSNSSLAKTEAVEVSSPVRPGDVLLGKYEVERVIGAGGMGVVVAARHVVLGQRVALKFLRSESAGRPETVARFHREAQAAARIQGENVARVYDVGQLPSGAPFLVMELLAGRDLAEVLRTEGPLPVDRAVACVLQACEGVAHAHALQIIHRDLKPSNLFLMLGANGRTCVKVLDFGISKTISGEMSGDNSLTRSHGVIGSPLYMSPEQIRSSKNVDLRSDVWSLGVILHELLAGQPPFHGPSASAVFASIAADPPVPLRDVAPHVPESLAAVVTRCLQKSPDRRYATVGELALALLPFAKELGDSSAERIAQVLGNSGATTLEPVPTSAGPATGTEWGGTGAVEDPTRRRRLRGFALVAALSAAAAVVAALLWGGRSGPPSSPSAAATAPPAQTSGSPNWVPPTASLSPSSPPAAPAEIATASAAPAASAPPKAKPRGVAPPTGAATPAPSPVRTEF